jgi:hypothetical protein
VCGIGVGEEFPVAIRSWSTTERKCDERILTSRTTLRGRGLPACKEIPCYSSLGGLWWFGDQSDHVLTNEYYRVCSPGLPEATPKSTELRQKRLASWGPRGRVGKGDWAKEEGKKEGGKAAELNQRGQGNLKRGSELLGLLKYNTGLDKQGPRGAEATLCATHLGLGERLMGNWSFQWLHVAPCSLLLTALSSPIPYFQCSRSQDVWCPKRAVLKLSLDVAE